MNMQQAKSIIAHFLKKKIEDINEGTLMDYTVVPSSLLLHRMYSALAEKGYVVDDPASITTYKDFLNALVISNNSDLVEVDMKVLTSNIIRDENSLSMGIDIEEISSFDTTDDYANNQFYKSNFSLEEIQYCITKPNPVQSFAGLFSAKEAIVKADNSFIKTEFNKLKIIHTNANKPIFKGFSLSISHSKSHVIAIACKMDCKKNQSLVPKEIRQLVKREIRNSAFIYMSIIVFLLCLIAIIFSSLML